MNKMTSKESLERIAYALEAIARELDGIRQEFAFRRIEANKENND